MRRAHFVIGIAMFFTAVVGPGSASAGVWRVQSVPTPVGTTLSALNGVSCPVTNSCMAVGSANVAGTQQPLADQWGGVRWELRPISNVPGPGALTGVSCLSRRWCLAVGTYHDASGAAVPFAETWTGHSWAFHSIRQPPGSTGESLSGVSCTSTDGCTAVGSYVQHADTIPVANRWHRGQWSPQTVPDLSWMIDPTYSALQGVSCVSATSCAAGGVWYDSDGPLVLAVSWNGSAWSLEPGPLQLGSLAGVSCPAPTSCVAAGVNPFDIYLHTHSTLIAASGNPGVTWGPLAPLQRADRLNAGFQAVSCPPRTVSTMTLCTAVGTESNGLYGPNGPGPTFIVVERYDNGTWTVQPAPGSGFGNDALNGVSCPVTSVCEAVGGFGTSAGSQNAVAERFS